MYVCICNSVSDKELERIFIHHKDKLQYLDLVEVFHLAKIGNRCGICIETAKEIYENFFIKAKSMEIIQK